MKTTPKTAQIEQNLLHLCLFSIPFHLMMIWSIEHDVHVAGYLDGLVAEKKQYDK